MSIECWCCEGDLRGGCDCTKVKCRVCCLCSVHCTHGELLDKDTKTVDSETLKQDRERLDWLQQQTIYGQWKICDDGTEDHAVYLCQQSIYDVNAYPSVRKAIDAARGAEKPSSTSDSPRRELGDTSDS